MLLPFLLLETIAATFDSLKPEAKTEPLQQFVSYIEENWIRSTLWLSETAKLTAAIKRKAAWRRLSLTSREVTGQLLKGCANINRPLMHWTKLRHYLHLQLGFFFIAK